MNSDQVRQAEGPGKYRSLLGLLWLVFLCATFGPIYGQGQFTRIYGSEDQDIPIPQLGSVIGQKDAAALGVLSTFMTAVNGSNWSAIQGSGMLISPNGKATAQSSATLTMQSGDAFRLDVTKPLGEQSIRLYGPYGEIQESDGFRHLLPAAKAMSGFLPFQRLLASSLTDSTLTVIERGMISIDGQPLHRITIEFPDLSSESSSATGDICVVDLYFSPTTSLLVKSASYVQIDGRDREKYLEVMSYSNYQAAGGVLIPFGYTETLNGQRQWVLQLTSANTSSLLAPSFFHF